MLEDALKLEVITIRFLLNDAVATTTSSTVKCFDGIATHQNIPKTMTKTPRA
jgi:hypothetical protein